jgi:hypothetical protein
MREESAMKLLRVLVLGALVLLALGSTPRAALACPS